MDIFLILFGGNNIIVDFKISDIELNNTTTGGSTDNPPPEYKNG